MNEHDGKYYRDGNSEYFNSFWSRVLDKIDGFYLESELIGLNERMSNYFADFPYLEDLDDITKDDLVELLFSNDYYSDTNR